MKDDNDANFHERKFFSQQGGVVGKMEGEGKFIPALSMCLCNPPERTKKIMKKALTEAGMKFTSFSSLLPDDPLVLSITTLSALEMDFLLVQFKSCTLFHFLGGG